MTTPDTEVKPIEDRTPVLPVRLEQPWAGFSCLHIGSFKIGIAVTDEDGTQDPDAAGTALEAWVTACNAYEPMREALENARALWGHRCFDTPQLTWLAQVDAALSTLPVNDRQTSDDVGILRKALRLTLGAYVTSRKLLERSEFLVNSDPVVIEARAALKGVPQPASEGSSALVR